MQRAVEEGEQRRRRERRKERAAQVACWVMSALIVGALIVRIPQ
jgi:hypothetical protein